MVRGAHHSVDVQFALGLSMPCFSESNEFCHVTNFYMFPCNFAKFMLYLLSCHYPSLLCCFSYSSIVRFHVYLASCPCSTDFRHVAPNTSGPTHQTSAMLVGTKLEGPDTVRGRRTTFARGFHLEHIKDISKVKIGYRNFGKNRETGEKHTKTSVAFLESEILSKFFLGPWNPRSERTPQDALLKHNCIEKVLCQSVLR